MTTWNCNYTLAPWQWTIIALALLFALGGCGYSQYAGKTTASYEKSTEGAIKIIFESDKEENGLDAKVDPKTGEIRVKVAKAGAQESAVAAALESNKAALEIIKELMPLLKAAATKTP